jgi:hypothetical protein
MDATTDLIYSTLNRNSIGFNDNEFSKEIELFSLEELNNYIEKLTNGDWKDEEYRDEKLRLCLRFRNAYLIQLPYFHVTIEPETLGEYSNESEVIYFLNFKNSIDFEKFKKETTNKRIEEYTIGVFLIKENIFGYELLKQYCETVGYYKNIFFEINDSQYNNLVSRNRFLEVLYNVVFEYRQPASFCTEDRITFAQNGKRFIAARYPENDEKQFENFAPIIEILLDKMNLKGKSGFPFWIIIEVNQKYTSPGYPNYDYPADISFIKEGVHKLAEDGQGGYGFGTYSFIENKNLNFGVRVSIIAGEKLN